MPLSGPVIATVAILTFLPAWNQYLWPLMSVQTEELRPVLVGLDYFKQLNPVVGADHGLRLHDHHSDPRRCSSPSNGPSSTASPPAA